MDSVEARAHKRAKVTRAQLADALSAYYGDENIFYAGQCANKPFRTSIATRSEWINLELPLSRDAVDISLSSANDDATQSLNSLAVTAAIKRVAETVATGTRLVNAPIYRLKEISVSLGHIAGTVGISHFIDYALTLDLLENELIDALSDGLPTSPGDLPLRDLYLPDRSKLTDLSGRLCAGGPLALTAVARSRRARRGGQPDYVLLVQERSGRVLNSSRRLAVIPKAFHGPLADFTDDAQISATIERELEEELFGRPEVDSTESNPTYADPMHIENLSAPMRWLIEHPDSDAWSAECVGIGINAMTGNYELASLVVINDEEWWDRFGGVVRANWETEGLRRYSSLDRDTLAALIEDSAWSNEGLFAFTLAVRRLAEISGARSNLPVLEPEVTNG